TQYKNNLLAEISKMAAEVMIQVQNYEYSAGDRKSRGDQSESGRGIRRRDHAKAEEDDYEPGDQCDQQRPRNGRNRLHLQQRPKLAKVHHEGRRLCLKGALRVIVG